MATYSANVTMLWPEIDDPYDRFRAAAAAGFSRVERLFMHDLDASRVGQLLEELGLELVLFDPYPGRWDLGERGLLALPGREGELREAALVAIETAASLHTGCLNVLAGILPEGVGQARAIETAAANLTALIPAARAAGVTLVVEAINAVDWPGYAISTLEVALAVVRAVDDVAVRLQFDAYHVARAGGDLLESVEAVFPVIRHVQVADVPGRHQPGTGTLPLLAFIERLDGLGYQGLVGLEYLPEGGTTEALAWLPREVRG